jgi:hypothetical protein
LDEPVDSIIYKSGKKLEIGNPPYLEILTLKPRSEEPQIEHIYSEAVKNNKLDDNIFNIPGYGEFNENLALATKGV